MQVTAKRLLTYLHAYIVLLYIIEQTFFNTKTHFLLVAREWYFSERKSQSDKIMTEISLWICQQGLGTQDTHKKEKSSSIFPLETFFQPYRETESSIVYFPLNYVYCYTITLPQPLTLVYIPTSNAALFLSQMRMFSTDVPVWWPFLQKK